MRTELELSGEVAGDAAVLERLRRGDDTAFDVLVRAHRREIYRVARRLVGSHEDADEVAQETFVRAWRALGRFRGDASLRTWLTRIALNVARTLRSRRKETTGLEEADRVPDVRAGAHDEVERVDAGRRVRAAVATLPARQREVVVLKVFSAMTYRDVAQAMNLSEGAVKAHFHQAVSNLRRRMTRDAGGCG